MAAEIAADVHDALHPGEAVAENQVARRRHHSRVASANSCDVSDDLTLVVEAQLPRRRRRCVRIGVHVRSHKDAAL